MRRLNVTGTCYLLEGEVLVASAVRVVAADLGQLALRGFREILGTLHLS